MCLYLADNETKSISAHIRSDSDDLISNAQQPLLLGSYAFKHYAIQPNYPTCILLTDVPRGFIGSLSHYDARNACAISICIHERLENTACDSMNVFSIGIFICIEILTLLMVFK